MYKIEYDKFSIFVERYNETFGDYEHFINIYNDLTIIMYLSYYVDSYDLCALIALAQEYFNEKEEN